MQMEGPSHFKYPHKCIKNKNIAKSCINILTNLVYKFNICNIETVKELITMKKRRRKGQMTSRTLSGFVVHLSAWNHAQR